MNWSTHETIALIERWLPRDLIDSAAFAHTEAFARRLPDLFSSYYLECRLEEEVPRVDLLASITATAYASGSPRDRSLMAAELDHLSERAPDWARVARLLRMWTDPAAGLGSRIPLVWLEFDDMKHASGSIPNPCFHACVEPEYLRQGDAAAPSDAGADAHREVLASTFEMLLGHALPAEISRPLHACFERLPPPGRMIHVSAMLARTPAAIKLYGCVPAQRLESYLHEIGWPGSMDDVRGMLDRFCSPSTIDHMIYFDLAFEEHLTPYIGIVFSQLQLDAAGNRDPRREVLMEGLVRAGLCAPHKRDASMQWPGSDRVRYSGSSAPTRLRRWLDIKVSCHPERPMSAKAYLGFMPVFSLF